MAIEDDEKLKGARQRRRYLKQRLKDVKAERDGMKAELKTLSVIIQSYAPNAGKPA
jgi:ribosomal protein L9